MIDFPEESTLFNVRRSSSGFKIPFTRSVAAAAMSGSGFLNCFEITCATKASTTWLTHGNMSSLAVIYFITHLGPPRHVTPRLMPKKS